MRVLLDFKMKTDDVESAGFKGFGILQKSSVRFRDDRQDDYLFEFQKPDSVHLKRSGESKLEMEFINGKRTKATLDVTEMRIPLELETTQMELQTTRLELTYRIMDGDTTLSKHHLILVWDQPWKE